MPIEVLSLQSYQELSSELRQVTDENVILNDKRKNMTQKLSEYSQSGQSFSNNVNKLAEELNQYDFQIGLTDVEGTGIIISLSDNPDFGSVINDREIGLESLVHDNRVMKFEAGASACYQYVEQPEKYRNHYHLICVACGRMIHLDCSEMDELKKHMLAEHQFVLDSFKTVLYGHCENCAGK
jgi:hypothetical protein